MKITKIGPAVVAELKRRAVSKDTDIHALIEEFKAEGSGAHLIVSEGDGEVSILVPVDDAFEGPSKLQVTRGGKSTGILDEVKRSATVEVEGVGKFYQFVLSPLKYKQGVADDTRPVLGLRGEGPDGPWSPLGLETWFWEDFMLLTDLAVRGGVEMLPEVEVDARDPSWRKLSSDQRAFIEATLHRRVQGVVHESVIKEALDKAGADDGAISGALRSLSLALDGPPLKGAGQAVTAAQAVVGKAIEAAKPVLAKVLGEGLFDPEAFPQPLLRMAEDALKEEGEVALAKTLRDARQSPGSVQRPELVAALDRVYGSGFTEARAPSLALVDRALDGFGAKLGFEEVQQLRDLREQLDYQDEVTLFGADLADQPLSTATADAKLKELHAALKKGTKADEAQVFRLASLLQAAVNVPSARPTVIVLSGESGTAADTLMKRALAATESKPVEVQGALDLRMGDPVGVLAGSPEDMPGIAKGALVRHAVADGERYVCAITGADEVGAGVPDAEGRKVAERSFWSFFGQIQRDGWFRGYDPNDPEKALGAKVELGGGIFLLRTDQKVSELKEKMPPHVWAQLAPGVIDLGGGSAESAVVELTEALRAHLVTQFGLKDAEVALAGSASSFLTDLAERGMPKGQLQQLVFDQVVPRIYFSALEGSLAPKIRIELTRGLTPKERERLRDDWLTGKVTSFAGVGASPFTIFDAGRFTPEEKTKISARVAKKMDESAELGRLRAILAEYQLGQAADQKKMQRLLSENKQAFAKGDAAEKRIDELKFLNERAVWEIEDLTRLNQLAQKTIGELKQGLGEANARIKGLNADIGKMKKAGADLEQKLATAISERDTIKGTLRKVEGEFEAAIKGFAGEISAGDPHQVFALIGRTANGPGERYLRPLLTQLHLVATSRALQLAQSYQRDMSKFKEIAGLARAYVASSKALGVPADQRVLGLFENAARLSGNGWSRNLAADWSREVGAPSAHVGQDPGVVGNALRNLFRQLGVRLPNDTTGALSAIQDLITAASTIAPAPPDGGTKDV